MRRLVHIASYPSGPRVWVCGQRIHHGATGALLFALAVRHPWLALVGALLCAHDHADWRVWFIREALPPARVLTRRP